MLCCQSRRWNRVEASSKTRARYWSPISLRRCRPARRGWWPRSRARGSGGRRRRGAASEAAPATAPFGADQPIGGLQAVVEPVVDVAELQELDVGELDHLQGVGALGVGDQPGRPVEHDEVVGRVREAQPGRLANFVRLSGSGSSRTSPAIQSVRSSSQPRAMFPS